MDAVFIACYVGFVFVGLLVGRWLTLIVPLVVVPLLYLGLQQGWWGYGLGDGWQIAAMLALVVAVAITAAGVAFRQIVWRR